MSFQAAIPVTEPQKSPMVPPGWRAEWSTQYSRYFYINENTNESTWCLPVQASSHQVQHSIQRKPVPTQHPHSPAVISSPISHGACLDSQQQSYVGNFAPQQQQQQPDISAKIAGAHRFSPPLTPSSISLNNGHTLVASPNAQVSQPRQQPHEQPSERNFYGIQRSSISTSPTGYQQSNYPTPSINSYTHYPPPPPCSSLQYAQHPSNFHQQTQQQYQQQIHPNLYRQDSNRQAQQPKNSSMLGSSLMGGKIMTKMTAKLTQLQKPTENYLPSRNSASILGNSAQNEYGKPKTSGSEWKKWTKRAAVGVAAVGALALGADAMDGGIFDGATAAGDGGFGGGGGTDFSSGDWSGGDAQAALDANAAQLAIEQQGQDNALMLLDPPGTTYTVVDSNSLI